MTNKKKIRSKNMAEKKLEDLGIDKIANASAENQPNRASGSDLMFEPAAELIELPSHGYLYRNVTNDPDIIEHGSVRIRPMTVHEEKILTTPRLIKSGQAIDMIFRNCIKSNIDPQDLLSSDRVYLMLWLRSISYGNIYRFYLQSPDPNNPGRFEYEVDLSNHPIKEFDDPNISEPFEFTFPVCKYTVYFRLPRGKDEIEIMKMQNQPKKVDDLDESVVKRLSSIIVKLEDPEGNEIEERHYDAFVNSLVARDASTWRNYIEEIDCGVEDIKDIEVPGSDYTFDSPIPITESFFRV